MVLAVERRQRILERVAERQSIQIGELAQQLGVSEMTIRRDVSRLERDGFLRRTYGGATAHVTKALELAFNARSLHNAPNKRLIGMCAAKLVADELSLFVGLGTTAEQFALFLPPNPGRLVVTGSLPVASLLGSRPGRVVVLGGSVRSEELACSGPVAQATVGRYHAQAAVLGAAGISAERGITETDDETAEIHRLMIERSQRLVVIADHSKVGAAAPAAVAPASSVQTLVTDEGSPSAALDALREAGVRVLVARRASLAAAGDQGVVGLQEVI